MRYLTVEIGDGNPGATAVLWQVAQQTALRNVTILAGAGPTSHRRMHLCPFICPTAAAAAGSAAVGLDMASAEYVHWDGLGGTPAGYNLGGGGVVADVVVVGGRAGVRTAATQVRPLQGQRLG